VSVFGNSSDLKMGAVRSSETPVGFCETAQHQTTLTVILIIIMPDFVGRCVFNHSSRAVLPTPKVNMQLVVSLSLTSVCISAPNFA
jgi:hypothetical protein